MSAKIPIQIESHNRLKKRLENIKVRNKMETKMQKMRDKTTDTAELEDLAKAAGAIADMILPAVGAVAMDRALPGGLGSTLMSVGEVVGTLNGEAVNTPKRRKYVAAMPSALSMFPVVGGSKIGLRLRGVAEESREDEAESPIANLAAEYLGHGTSLILPALLGAYLGRDSGHELVGALGGAALPMVAGGLAAAVTKRRTKQEQTDSETTRRALLKYLVPGLGTYDRFKRYGRSKDWDDEVTADRIAARAKRNRGES